MAMINIERLLEEQRNREDALRELATRTEILSEAATEYLHALKAARRCGWPDKTLKSFPEATSTVNVLANYGTKPKRRSSEVENGE